MSLQGCRVTLGCDGGELRLEPPLGLRDSSMLSLTLSECSAQCLAVAHKLVAQTTAASRPARLQRIARHQSCYASTIIKGTVVTNKRLCAAGTELNRAAPDHAYSTLCSPKTLQGGLSVVSTDTRTSCHGHADCMMHWQNEYDVMCSANLPARHASRGQVYIGYMHTCRLERLLSASSSSAALRPYPAGYPATL